MIRRRQTRTVEDELRVIYHGLIIVFIGFIPILGYLEYREDTKAQTSGDLASLVTVTVPRGKSTDVADIITEIQNKLNETNNKATKVQVLVPEPKDKEQGSCLSKVDDKQKFERDVKALMETFSNSMLKAFGSKEDKIGTPKYTPPKTNMLDAPIMGESISTHKQNKTNNNDKVSSEDAFIINFAIKEKE